MTDPSKEEIERALAQLATERDWYQPITVEGVPAPVQDPSTRRSSVHGEGKWTNFIEPLLPERERRRKFFLEVGSNAGLHLLRAAEAGFGGVLGIEADAGWYRQAEYVLGHHARSEPETYARIECRHARIGSHQEVDDQRLRVQSGGPKISLGELPRPDVTLLANVLYWMDSGEAREFVSELALHCQHAIVVSVDVEADTPGPLSLAEVRDCFAREWMEEKYLRARGIEDDPVPRPIFSVLFASRVEPQ
ncbi:MAG: hypothetical protein P8R42_11580 [Candidatus Binatia bacterium]|nr:hypothetical protein [Candidatus Binatia bacterium]